MSRRESIGRVRTASQSESSEPTMKMVTVAVLPPRLPPGMAPPTGIGAAEAFSWDEAVNWQHNEPADDKELGRRKSFFRKMGLTTQRKRSSDGDDLPPFVMRQVPYDTWRKHYAKDKDGNYHGTLAPAEDCLLKPEDVKKWRLDDPVTKGDRWTRGSHALPVYAEARAEGPAPNYDVEAPNQPPSDHLDGRATMADLVPTGQSYVSPVAAPLESGQRRNTIADGKTAAEIIAEAQAKPKPRMTMKQMFSKGATMAMMGN